MSKRSRALYEAELQAQQSPFVSFGMPLPPLDPDVRDDGSYVPVWKQEVRDEKGRRRLHGAFTGGWSAGYYNTVGSKEGWTPSTFVSSRTNRRKDDPGATQLRPEDFMDEEDLADAEEAKTLHTSQSFAGLGLTQDDSAARPSASGLAGLFRVEGETMGTKLLKKMGWKEGQGIGPKVRRAARLDVGGRRANTGKATYLFAPENVVTVQLVKKTNRKGLGYEGEARLGGFGTSRRNDGSGRGGDDSDDEVDDNDGSGSVIFGRKRLSAGRRKDKKISSTGIGMGVLNDTGSDEEDPYDIGPRITFNRVIGGDKKKKKQKPKSAQSAAEEGDGNTAVKPKLVFSKRSTIFGKSFGSTRRCHDGRPPLVGFILARVPDPLTSDTNVASKFPPPTIPADWKSAKQPRAMPRVAGSYLSTADAAKASKMDPKSRAAVLGESQLPGKSVFDFMSPAARDRIAAASGRTNLPAAKGEIPAEYALTEEEKHEQLLREVPSLDKATAVAAITRGARGGGPYQDDEAKRSRYRAYLEHQAGITPALPPKLASVSNDDWLRELHEFYNCARIFKPMSGLMASRFTTSSSANQLASGSGGGGKADDKAPLVSRPPPKPQDPAEEAAKMGMYGPLTRSVQDFFPTRLLCKRMGVSAPAIVQPDQHEDAGRPSYNSSGGGFGDRATASSRAWAAAPEPSARGPSAGSSTGPTSTALVVQGSKPAGAGSGQMLQPPSEPVVVHADRNEALEGQRAGDDVFRAVFGDSDDDDD